LTDIGLSYNSGEIPVAGQAKDRATIVERYQLLDRQRIELQ
jgi:hypothetical protein